MSKLHTLQGLPNKSVLSKGSVCFFIFSRSLRFEWWEKLTRVSVLAKSWAVGKVNEWWNWPKDQFCQSCLYFFQIAQHLAKAIIWLLIYWLQPRPKKLAHLFQPLHLCFTPFLSLRQTVWQPYRLSHIIALCINLFYLSKDQSLIFSLKSIKYWRCWKMRFFWFLVFPN
jgi:hypothetical protein